MTRLIRSLDERQAKKYAEWIVSFIDGKISNLGMFQRLLESGFKLKFENKEVDLFSKMPQLLKAVGIKIPNIPIVGKPDFEKMTTPQRQMIIQTLKTVMLNRIKDAIAKNPDKVHEAAGSMLAVLVDLQNKYLELQEQNRDTNISDKDRAIR